MRCSGLENNLTECGEYSLVVSESSRCRDHSRDASVLCPTGIASSPIALTLIPYGIIIVQNVQMISSHAVMEDVMDKSQHVYHLRNCVMVSVTVVKERMNWTTTVHVHLREQLDWWMVLFHIVEEWSSAGMQDGPQFATDSIVPLHLLYVVN